MPTERMWNGYFSTFQFFFDSVVLNLLKKSEVLVVQHNVLEK